MRIGLLCPYNVFNGGGVQECVRALQAIYEKRGHYAKIVTPHPREYTGEIPDSVITLGASMNTTAFAGTAWQWSVSVDTDAIDEVLEREKFDVLHFHEPWIPLWGRQLVLRSNAANVATMHGRFLDTMTAKTLTTVVIPYTRPMIKHFDAFTAVSEPATEYLLSLKQVPITLVPNGIDIKRYSAKPSGSFKHPKNKTIFYVGRLEDRKGILYLLKAFDELTNEHDDVQLLIAGKGPDEKSLKKYVSSNKISNVTFLGFISDEEKIYHLHKADVFCSPAIYGESFGIVLLEAMAAECPIVAGDNTGYQSVLVDKGALSLVNPRDTIDFARRLSLMLYDEELRKIWKNWAKKYVRQFDYPKIADQYYQIYEQAIKNKKKSKT